MEQPNFSSDIEKHEQWISQLISDFNWDGQTLLEKDKFACCSNERGHKMPSESLKKHESYCCFREKGYSDSEIDELALSESKFDDIHPQRIPIDYVEVIRIIKEHQPNLDITVGNIKQFLRPPGNEIDTALSQSTQLALYEYFISLTEKNETPILEFNQNDGSERKKEKSELEILAELRDAKRRRQSYKGKSTHTGSKNYSEIIREVIANQMEIVQHEWEESLPEKKHKASDRYSPEKKKKHNKTSDSRRDYHSKKRR